MEKLLQVDDADIPLYRPDVKYKQVVVSVYYYTSDGRETMNDSLITRFDNNGRFMYIGLAML